jgi:two-component system LytT family sensor kinase
MKKWVIILLHAGYWFLYLMLIVLLTAFVFSTAKNVESHAIIFNNMLFFMSAFAVLPAITAFYISYTILFPRFLFRRKIGSLFIFTILTSLFCGVLGCICLMLTYDHAIFNMSSQAFVPVFIMIAINGLLNSLVAMVMRGFITWYADIKWKEALSKKNQETELALVKSQLNPHFLFNTINNIDILIGEDAVKASLYLNKLSDMMRFMLYETKTETIPLLKELTYIDKYIDLQKIRTANANYVEYVVEGNPSSKEIAPMLFIPFIENAFKHASQKRTGSAIVIKIVVEPKRIDFYCENSYSTAQIEKPEQGGLGNEIILKRIELLYPENHTLEIKDKDQQYEVKLTLTQK